MKRCNALAGMVMALSLGGVSAQPIECATRSVTAASHPSTEVGGRFEAASGIGIVPWIADSVMPSSRRQVSRHCPRCIPSASPPERLRGK